MGEVMKIKIRAATDIGKVRDHNEDSHIVLGGDQSPPSINAVMVVADGMGGHAAGEVASQMTVDGILDILNHQPDRFRDLEGNEFGVFLSTILGEVNQGVWQAGQEPDKRGMGTTCTLVVIRSGQLFIAQIGDSRAYLLRKGELHQITTDHSWVEEAVSQGILTREQARIHPNRNVITRAIGLSSKVEVDISTMDLQKDDLLLLCSDGLNSMITDEKILEILKANKLSNVCDALIKGANKAGGHDNTTVIASLIKQVDTNGHSSSKGCKTQRIKNNPPKLKRLIDRLFGRK